jgi:hypothetical protein
MGAGPTACIATSGTASEHAVGIRRPRRYARSVDALERCGFPTEDPDGDNEIGTGALRGGFCAHALGFRVRFAFRVLGVGHR